MFYTISFVSWFLFGLVSSKADASLVKAGSFQNYAHGIGGQVFIKDERTLIIKGFTYDGAGPDAFFWAGTSGKPSTVGTILPYPFEGTFFDYEDSKAPILSGRFNGEEITLTLPETLKTTDLKWLSVWCRAFRVNFGDMSFPENLVSDAEIPDEMPPPLIEPIHNAHDPNRHDDDWKEDADAEQGADAESAYGAEPEAEGSATSFVASNQLLASILVIAAYYQL